MLESSVSEPEDVLPSFGQTLSQLSAKEARFVEAIHRSNSNETASWSLNEIINADHGMYGRKHLLLMIQDVERLGLLVRNQSTSEEAAGDEMGVDPKVGVDMQYPRAYGLRLIDRYSLSVYGRQFIKAVTPKLV